VGIEVPNSNPDPVSFRDLLETVLSKKKAKLPIAMGENVYGQSVMADIASMPHILVSGTTGSGKSVFINTLICSLLFSKSPKHLRFIMIDPKMIELSPFNGIPHLLRPVITDVTEAKMVLKWAEKEMDRRYKVFAEMGARNLESFNKQIQNSTGKSLESKLGRKLDWKWETLPQIVVVIDELADLMITQGKEVEIPITRIAQKARAAGIHMVVATQRPSAEIVTGLIKTNFPTRVAFKVSSAIDSRTILDEAGAEKLLGLGDMLYKANGKSTERIQGSFIEEDEVRKIVDHLSN
jgi:S-DNA-T family DNA segregation ATPase FtsK/SpoIIIE